MPVERNGNQTMAVVKAKNLQDTEALLHSGINKVELDWEIGSDDFSVSPATGANAARKSPALSVISWCRLKASLSRRTIKPALPNRANRRPDSLIALALSCYARRRQCFSAQRTVISPTSSSFVAPTVIRPGALSFSVRYRCAAPHPASPSLFRCR